MWMSSVKWTVGCPVKSCIQHRGHREREEDTEEYRSGKVERLTAEKKGKRRRAAALQKKQTRSWRAARFWR